MVAVNIFAQNIAQIDSVSSSICQYMDEMDEIENDSLKMKMILNNRIIPYLETFTNTLQVSEINAIGDRLYFRTQRNCIEFSDLLLRLAPPKESRAEIKVKPTSELSKKELKSFKKKKEFYYFEPNGDKTNVSMKKGVWTDLFKDETYSKLTYQWTEYADFELVFVKSNNQSRANYSIKGDIYLCTVISKESSYYMVSIKTLEDDTYSLFKLYFK